MSVSLQIVLSENLFIRDPEQTELGKKIVDYSIKLIDELGFERFTFKKLAEAIGSTEASVYRYFENKHKLLIYLASWYWSWLEYLLDYETHNIEDPSKKVTIAAKVLANASTYDPNFSHIDENALHRIVVSESSKAIFTKEVDGENEQGLFQGYKNLIEKLSNIFVELNSDCKYVKAIAITAVEASNKQIFLAQHLPTITEIRVVDNDTMEIAKFLEHLILSSIC